jgi:AcrR family transcriptional regulator
MAESGKGDGYHHGNLRRALLDATLQVAMERGLEAVTLREVARQAQVSHAAPYHHFADKAALLEAVAVETYEALATTLHAARQATSGSALDRLQALAVAYVRLAIEQPARFSFLYRVPHGSSNKDLLAPVAEVGEAGGSAVEQAAQGAYRVLLATIEEAQAAGLIAPGNPALPALVAWSTMHGLAVLLTLEGGRAWSVSEQALAAAVAERVINGLRAR